MPDCDYCSESFDDESSYLRHLKQEHEGELSRLDQRRVGSYEEDSGYNTGMIVLGVILVSAAAVVGFLVIDGAGSAGSTHEHGTMEIVIDGDRLDLNDPQFIEQDPAFHFHGGDAVGDGSYVWHTHEEGVTIQEALETLGIQVDSEGTELTYDGETYDAEDVDTELEITVNAQTVEPGSHELEGGSVQEARQNQGDDVRVIVETNG